MFDEFLIRWTARLAVACYAARVICDAGPQARSTSRIARSWWTIGCIIFVVHVATAFHFAHHWDHAAAFAQTARRTAEMTGWNSGIGLYVNEVFLCLWLADTILWRRNIAWPHNRRAYWTVQAIFAFLMFQATAVFGPPFWKPVNVALIAVVTVQLLRRAGRGKNVNGGNP